MGDRQYSYQTGDKHTFTWVDYLLFVLMLLVSAVIGVFYAIKDRKKNTTKDFLLAGGNMSLFPVALSLLASFMSAITLLGTPAEMYNYTTMYWWIGLSYVFAIFASAHIYIPIFYRLNITSAFEYLEQRFGPVARITGACTYIVQMTIYMAIVLYAPSLALNAVTGVDLWGLLWSVGCVCIFYTTIGGMKAVLWTDSFQTLMMLSGLLAVLIQGSIEAGGFAAAWDLNVDRDRIDFLDFSANPATRHSVWSLAIGGVFTWTYVYGTNQAQIQRAITCPSLNKARIAIWLNLPGLWIVLYLSCLIGTVLFAFYRNCDPLTFNLITGSDQLLPLFVMDVLGHIKGIPGLFVACIFSGALSTISSGLNSISAVILQDIVKTYCVKEITEAKATWITRGISFGFGFLMIGLTYVASLLGGVLQAAMGLYGMIGGPIMGLFTLGMLFPWANQKGAVAGLFTGLILLFWIGIGYHVHKPIVATKSIINVDDCNWNLTTTMSPVTQSLNSTGIQQVYATSTMASNMTAEADEGNVLDMLYSLSYMWYTATAVATTVGVGLLVSFITGHTKPKTLNPKLICPIFDIMFPYLPEKILKPLRFGIDYTGLYDNDNGIKATELKNVSTKDLESAYTADELKTKFPDNESFPSVVGNSSTTPLWTVESTPTIATTDSGIQDDDKQGENDNRGGKPEFSTHL